MKTWVAGGALQAAALAAVAAGGAAEARPCVRHLAHYAWRAPWSGLQRGASCRYALSGFALDAATWPAGLRAWPHTDAQINRSREGRRCALVLLFPLRLLHGSPRGVKGRHGSPSL